jgi:hypothetical protein
VNAGCYVGVEDNGTGIVGQEDRCQREGMACSIYPYVTASDGDVNVQRGGPVSRCVDIGEDARKYLLYSAPLHFCLEDAKSLTKRPQTGQSAILNFLYTSTGPWSNSQGLNSSLLPTKYQQIFSNAGEIPYCSGFPSDCVTDGAEFDRQGVIFTYDPLTQQRPRQRQRQYRLSGGESFTVMQEMEVGRQVLVPRVRDRERFLEVSERGGGEMERMLETLGEFLYFDVEEIREEILEEEILEGFV